MPTYDYVCDACGHAWEEFQSMSAKHIQVCPECHKKKARRLIGMGAGLIFKGSGFYSTDYKKSGGPAKADAESSTGGSGGGGGNGDAAPSAGSAEQSGSSATTTGDPASAAKNDGAAKADAAKPSTTGSTSRPSSAKKS